MAQAFLPVRLSRQKQESLCHRGCGPRQALHEDDDRPRTKKRRKKEQKKNDHLVLEKSILNGGIGVGLLAMGVATVWFIVGLLNDWIFWYPPIPFVLGLIAVIKGLVNPEESD